MKLIDLLVQELPSRGGWPEGSVHAWCDLYGEVRFRNGGCEPDFYPLSKVDVECRVPSLGYEDDVAYIITREQYESALAASQHPAWDGEGLPPVGCEVEVIPHNNRWGFLGAGAHVGRVIAYDGEDFWFKDDNSGNVVSRTDKVDFRPILTEADRKREETTKAIMEVVSAGNGISTNLYDAIAAGKIPGVKLE